MELRAFQNRLNVASLLAVKLGHVLSACPDLLRNKTPAEYAAGLSENEWMMIAKHAGRPGYLPSEPTRKFVVEILRLDPDGGGRSFVPLLEALAEVHAAAEMQMAATGGA